MRTRWTALVLCTVLLTGCGAKVRTNDDAANTVTVTNCGKEVSVRKAPSKVVAYDSGIVETLFALGLQDRLAGYVMGSGHQRDIESSPWREQFAEAPRIHADDISKEAVLEANADFVYAGWGYGFNEDEGLTPRHLSELGIDAYVLSETCRNSNARGTMPPLQALYTDLRNLGKIFGVADRAEQLVKEYQEVVRKAEASVPDGERPKVFQYDSGTDKPFTGGRYAASHEIITRGGGEHVFGDLEDSWTTVTWEAVVERNPEVIVINDYGEPSAREKIEFLKNHAALSDVPAIKNDRFLTLPYAALVQGPRNPDAVLTVADYLNEIR